MAEKKDKQEKRRKVRVHLGKKANTFFVIAVLLILTFGLTVVNSQLKGVRRQEEQRQVYLEQIQEAQETKEQLTLLLSYVTSDEYKRSIAHDQLGLLAPNEIRFVPAN